jgi:hypothetical protein
MRRPLFVAILGVWVVMLALLVQRTWLPTTAEMVSPTLRAPVLGEEWMGVYYKDQKIGYTRHSISADGAGFEFSEESLLRLVVLSAPQTVRTRMSGHATPSYTLRDVQFELGSGVGNLSASGVVQGAALHLTLRTGKDTTEQTLPLSEPVYLPSTLRASISPGTLQPGRQLAALVFDPTTLKNERMQVSVEGEETLPHSNSGERVWRVREEFHGMQTTAWIDASGGVRREEGPMGFTLVRETADQALHGGWSTTDAALDLVASAAVPVSRPIDEPRQRRSIRLRLSGIELDGVPSDDEQRRDGAVVQIVRPDVASLESYTLPYHNGHEADLAPTAFLQSDHPRILALAREILGDERDAKRAAVRLNDWVYEHLRKVPTISIPNALQVLDMGEGDCNEHATLLAALGRAAGLPTRVAVGAVYLDGAFFYHAWCEVWLGRWVSIDPALHQFPADATHLKFVTGDLEEQIAMVGIIGRLGIEVLPDEGTSSGGGG